MALAHLQRGNIAPVDLAQAAIGPGMAVYTRYAKVLDAEGKPLSVREALALINQTLDEALAEQEGDFDADSRWALAWFEQSGFAEGEYGVAEQLSKAKNTSVAGMVEAGILESKRGKVRLLRPEELPADWDPATDPRLTAWEIVHHLIRVLEAAAKARRPSSSPSSAPRPRSPASWPTASTPSASARSARPRRSPTTASSRAGPRSRGWPVRAVSREPSKWGCSRRRRTKPWPSRNQERVGKAMELLRAGLAPFVEREFKNLHQAQAADAARRYLGDDRTAGKKAIADWDVAALLKLMWEAWNEVFGKTLGRAERSLVQELRDWRNKWAHQEPFSSDDADRALDSMARLLTAVSAPQADEVGKMKMELRRADLRRAGAQREDARPAAR